MLTAEKQEDICMYCSFWYTSRRFMEDYGEGTGRCMADGDITFCTHKCPFSDHQCDPKEENK